MKWIELHTEYTTILVNTDHITDIWPAGDHCMIWLDITLDGTQHHIAIQESYAEVKKMILK